MSVQGANQRVTEILLTWKGVRAQPHRFGGTEFLVGERREIGHVHGDYLADIPFTTKMRAELVAVGRAEPHHVLPESGWISVHIRAEADVERVIELFRLSYELAQRQMHQAG
jgi:hypothetical protein